MNITFITGNQHKADYLAKWLELPVSHTKIDLLEIQSLDSRVVAEHKVHQAYDIVRAPVLVEDVALTFKGMGQLPGTLIKWFLEELELQDLCKLADSLSTREATASITYALFDGKKITYFEAQQAGRVAAAPKGDLSFGWNPIFIPDGSERTYAEMTDEELKPFSFRARAIKQLKHYLTSNQ